MLCLLARWKEKGCWAQITWKATWSTSGGLCCCLEPGTHLHYASLFSSQLFLTHLVLFCPQSTSVRWWQVLLVLLEAILEMSANVPSFLLGAPYNFQSITCFLPLCFSFSSKTGLRLTSCYTLSFIVYTLQISLAFLFALDFPQLSLYLFLIPIHLCIILSHPHSPPLNLFFLLVNSHPLQFAGSSAGSSISFSPLRQESFAPSLGNKAH